MPGDRVRCGMRFRMPGSLVGGLRWRHCAPGLAAALGPRFSAAVPAAPLAASYPHGLWPRRGTRRRGFVLRSTRGWTREGAMRVIPIDDHEQIRIGSRIDCGRPAVQEPR